MKTFNHKFYCSIAVAACFSLLLSMVVDNHQMTLPPPVGPPTVSIVPSGHSLSPNNLDAPKEPAIKLSTDKVKNTHQTPQPATAPTLTAATRPQYQYRALLSPSGPLYTNQPFLSRITASSAWQMFANTNNAPVIAVVDTGFALDHDSLKNRWTQTSRWDFVHNDNDPRAGATNPNGGAVSHGTITAGLASILNPNARIMPLQALDDDGIGYTDGVGAAVRYAADHGANVISLSLGSPTDDPYLHDQISYAMAKGIVVIAAAGNDGCNCMVYPGNYPEVLAVGASDSANNRATFSSYGANMDLLAPGTAGDVCSSAYTAANSTSAYTCSYSGTSLSTPIVAGLAALMLQQHPGASPTTIMTLINQNAAKLSSMNGQYFTLKQGYGLVQAGNAIAAVTIPPPFGLLLNKSSASISTLSLSGGGQMDSTCIGIAGADCSLRLNGPNEQIISLGDQTLDEYGGAEFSWNAATLGLTPGPWTLVATTSYAGQTKTSSILLTISP